MNDIETVNDVAENTSDIPGIFSFFINIKDSVNQFVENIGLQDFFSSIVIRYNRFHHSVINEFGPNGSYILIAFAFFLVLIAAIYAKSVLDTFQISKKIFSHRFVGHNGLFYVEEVAPNEKTENEDEPIQENYQNANDDYDVEYEETEEQETEPDAEYEEDDMNEKDIVVSDDTRETPDISSQQIDDVAPENEKQSTSESEELPKRVMAEIEKDEELSEALIAASEPKIDENLYLSNEYMRLKTIMKRHAEAERRRKKRVKEATEAELRAIAEEESKSFRIVITLMLNLLGRGVSEQKIVQILYQTCQEMFDEAKIFQLVRGIRDFVGLCNSGRLDYIPERKTLPQNEKALYALSCGDTTPSLMLLQSFLNMEMEKAESEQGVVKEITHAQAANCACIMGNLAYLDDKPLAHNAFELSTELSPRNVHAWNRLADMYLEEDLVDKAMIAYQSVIDYSDDIMYPEQLANAKNKLAQYYEKQGLQQRADQYKQESYTFYKDYGLYAKLTDAEEEALSVIAENTDIKQSIHSLITTTEYNHDM